MSLTRTPKCSNYSQHIRSPFINITFCFGPHRVVCGRGRAAVPLHNSRCLSLVWCYTADLVIKHPILHSSPLILSLSLSPLSLFPRHPVVSPTGTAHPLRVHYLFHLDKINSMAHASHSNQFQPRQHNQTKRWTRFNVAVDTSRLLIFSLLLHWRTLCSPSTAAMSTSVNVLMCECKRHGY